MNVIENKIILIITQDEISTTQDRLLTSKIVGDLLQSLQFWRLNLISQVALW